MDITRMNVAGWECRYYGMNHDELERRRDAVRTLLKKNNIGVLLANDMVRGGYFQWFLGAGPSERPTEELLIIPVEGKMKICLTSECFSDEQQNNYKKIDAVNSQDARFGDAQNVPALYYKYISDHLTENQKVGILYPDSLRKTVKDYLEKEIPNLEFVDITEETDQIKAAKSEEEQRILQDVAQFHDRLFSAVGVMAFPGRTEKDFVTELRYRAYQMGCGGEDVMRTAVVHFTSAADGSSEKARETVYPGRILKEGDRLNLKVQCVVYDDFYGVLGRTFVLGEPSEKTIEDNAALIRVQEYAASILKPGITLEKAAKLTEIFRSEEGLPKDHSNFLYGVGHLAGEFPNLVTGNQWPIQKGTVLAIAPELEREGCETMYLADLFLVTEDGAKRLNTFPQEVQKIFIS